MNYISAAEQERLVYVSECLPSLFRIVSSDDVHEEIYIQLPSFAVDEAVSLAQSVMCGYCLVLTQN